MDSGDAIRLCILIILLLLSAFFSSAETALMTVNHIRIRSLAEEGNKKAATVLKILDSQDKMLSAILIGNNIVNLSASSLATLLATRLLGSAGAGVATGILTLCVLIFGEISPKNIANIYSEKFSMLYASVIYAWMKLLTPVIFILNLLVKGFMFILRVDMDHKKDHYTEDELRVIVDESHEKGVLESEEREMINNVFDFDDSCAKDIMVPRIDMQMIDVSASYDEVMEAFRENMFTRIPVFEETTDNVIGILNIKDLIFHDQESFDLRSLLREPFLTYEYKNNSELFREMKIKRASMAIVLDEYGATAGLVTLEDMIEEIVGEIRDEFDEAELDEIKKNEDGSYSIAGAVSLDDVNHVLDTSLESEEYDSLGGYVIGLLNHLPEEGESIEEDGILFTVEKRDKNRIERIKLVLPEKEEAFDAQEEESC